MKKLTILLTLLVLSFAGHAKGPDHSQWENDIQAFEASDKANPAPANAVLFIGSSSIRMWSTLADDFSGYRVINRGFGGSDIDDSTAFADRILAPYHPVAIVMYAGDNDIQNGDTPEQVRDDFAAFVAKARQEQPGVPIAFISIKPSIARLSLLPNIQRANTLIRQWAMTQKNVAFLDIAPAMVDAKGQPKPELFREDGLHMTPAGYALWVAQVRPWLADHATAAEVKRQPNATTP
ncbi:Lysophospholipase L1 [Luteibacter sp. UNC138MFCol5.1]|uniref:SGNH/GDSL hydrolase family protein n=1 Tax=Luteibacter sp. UNC138MFCol5.1 TaxID=1502774 RepID=UPI0008C29D80|nr:SGNH/GDSL hydrolase family protein [Luteibacter sp. UNC138MFCol5.1]SEO33297.1 Lysophospholipase L1 [Luteibacter sp. UNC138MFCol5.1]